MNTNNAVQLQDKIDGHDIYPRTLASLVQTSDGSNIEDGKANKSDVYTKNQVNALLEDKQNTLVSGSNIKTINGQSLLGDGNITVAAESDKIRQPYATEDTSYRILLNGEPNNYTDTKQSVAQAADVSINPVLRQTTFYSNKDQRSYPITITEGKITFGGATNYIDEDNYTGTADKATKDASGNVISETYMTKRAVQEELAEKQDTLESGVNIKTVNNQSLLGRGNVVIDSAPDLSNYYTKDEVDRSLRGKQNTLTFDETPQRNSPNVVKSGGVASALATKQNTLVSGQSIKTINGESILGSGNIDTQVVQNLNNQSIPRHFLMSTVAHSGDAGDTDYTDEVAFTPTERILTVTTTKNPDSETPISYPVNIENGGMTFGYLGNEGHIDAEEYTGRALGSETQIMGALAVADVETLGVNDGAAKIGFYNEDEDEATTVREGILSKQDKLVSGTNIKTINDSSILGSGNLALAGLDEATSKSIIYKALKQGEEQMLVLKSMGNLDIIPLDSSLEQFDLNEDGAINYAEISIIYSIILGEKYNGFYYKAIEDDTTNSILLQKSPDGRTWTTVEGRNPDITSNGAVDSNDVTALYDLIANIASQQGIAYDQDEFNGATTVFSAYDSTNKKIVIGYNFSRYINNPNQNVLLTLDPSPNVIYCNSFNNKLYRWNANKEQMVEINFSTSATLSAISSLLHRVEQVESQMEEYGGTVSEEEPTTPVDPSRQ